MDDAKQIKSISQISSEWWPFDRTIHSRNDESSQMMDQTNHRGTPTITQKEYQPTWDKQDKYYERMKQKYHVFWPGIKRVLAIT
jgi:hypothetical protein